MIIPWVKSGSVAWKEQRPIHHKRPGGTGCTVWGCSNIEHASRTTLRMRFRFRPAHSSRRPRGREENTWQPPMRQHGSGRGRHHGMAFVYTSLSVSSDVCSGQSASGIHGSPGEGDGVFRNKRPLITTSIQRAALPWCRLL